MKKIILMLGLFLIFGQTNSQRCQSTGQIPIISIDFENNIPGTAVNVMYPGVTVFGISNNFNSSGSFPWQDGTYRIDNFTSMHSGWHQTGGDHTTGSGNMMLINAMPGVATFYQQQITGLCPGVTYTYTIWFKNLIKSTSTSLIPNITMEILGSGNTTNPTLTSTIPQNSSPQWISKVITFTQVSGSTITLRLINNIPSGTVGNDFAIDDISFTPANNISNSFFNGISTNTNFTTNQGTSVTLNAQTPTPTIPNVVYQWEVSSNGGLSWGDIIGANSLNYTYTPTFTGIHTFRLKYSASGNINSPNCRYTTNCIQLNVDAPCNDKCYWKLTGNTGITAPTVAIGTKIPTSGTGSGNYIGTQNTAPLVMATDQFERMRIAENGNVGIGTTTPNAKLQVRDGDLRLDDIAVNTSNNGSLFFGGTTYNGQNGMRMFYFGQNTGLNSQSGTIEVKTTQNTFNNDGIAFRADRNSGGTERMRILSSNGNVGIGTTTPEARLSIFHNTAAGQMRLGNVFGTTYNGVTMNGSIIDNDYNLISGLTDRNLYINRPTSFDIRFRMNNTDQMSINGAGNVGIGTTNPNARLHVSNLNNNTKVVIGNGNTANDGKTSLILGTSQDASGFADIQSVSAAGTNFGNLCLNYRGGNVGIGTTSPGNKTEITGNFISPIALPNTSNPNNISGLRLTDLNKDNRNTTIATNTFGNVLSVNNDGDVMMVRQGVNNGLMVNTDGITQLGRDCGSTTNDANLLNNRELPMSNNNFIFLDGNRRQTNGNTNINRVGIGEIQDCNLLAKLHVTRVYDANETSEPRRIGILSNLSDGRGTPTTGPTNGFQSAAYEGVNDAFNDGTNSGINLQVRNSTVNIGANIIVDDPSNISARPIFTQSTGININVSGANGNAILGVMQEANVGVRSIVQNAPNGIDYGIFADGGTNDALRNGVATNDYAGFFNGDVFTTSSFQPSDKNLKEDIKEIQNSSNLISKLVPYTYKYKANTGLSLPEVDQFGFIAQDVEKIFPTLVRTAIIPNSKENQQIKVVNYQGFIPLLWKAHQELAAVVEKQNNAVIENDALKSELARVNEKLANYDEKFALLEKSIAALCENGCGGLKDLGAKTSSEVDVLYQSIPNPTDDIALINYYLTREYKDATISVSTQDGKQIQSFKLEPKQGAGSVKVSLGTLASGTYLYTLVAGERIVDTKRLQIVK